MSAQSGAGVRQQFTDWLKDWLPEAEDWYVWIPILFVFAIVAKSGWELWATLADLSSHWVGAASAVTATFILSLMPFFVCTVQTITRRRQLRRLQTLKDLPISETAYFRAAENTINALRPVTVGVDYIAPLGLYVAFLALGFLFILFGYYGNPYFNAPHVILGGLDIPKTWDWATPNEELQIYQRTTFVVMASAFIGAYIYALGRLLDRVSNNDLYPISLHYYTCRTIIACFSAEVFRHSAYFFGFGGTSILILIGFATGLAPDLLLLALVRKAFQSIKVWHSRGEPSEHPTNLSLLMIDDLSKEKIDRLNELGIDNAQCLARQNPFLLWIRLPFDLGMLLDWIAQAQLYCLVRDNALTKLRAVFVNDICDLFLRLENDNTCVSLCNTLALTPECAKSLRRQLENDPSFVRLRQVRNALTATVSKIDTVPQHFGRGVEVQPVSPSV